MIFATDNGKRTKMHQTQREVLFKGCALSLDHNRWPVGLEFAAADNWREQMLVGMTMEEAKRVHRVLGEMIEVRTRQGYPDARRRQSDDE